MSIQSCCFCAHDVEKLWFWMCLRQASMLCHFWLFFKLFVVFLTAQWLLQHMGVAQVFDYDSYRRTQACFVHYATTHGPTSLVVNSGSFRWALPLFLYFRLGCRWSEENNIVPSERSLDFVHSSIRARAALCNYFLKDNSYRTEGFWICIKHLKSNPMESSHLENNSKRTINCPATRSDMNEPNISRRALDSDPYPAAGTEKFLQGWSRN